MAFQKKSQEPQIIDGVRSTDDVPARLGMSVADGREPARSLGVHTTKFDPQKGLWRFRSRYTSLQVLVWSEEDEYLPGGRKKPGKNKQPKFEEGYFETTDPVVAERLYANKSFGIGGQHWDADHEDELAREASYSLFKRSVKADPELFAQFRKDYAAGDFDDVLTAPEKAEVSAN